MQSSSGATYATMLTADAAVTRAAVSMPASGAVLNVAAEEIRVKDSADWAILWRGRPSSSHK
jgi:hypothetical protein